MPIYWNLQNILTHVVVPLASVDFLLTGVCCRLRKRSVLFVTIPPAAYALNAGIAYLKGWEFGRGIRYPFFS